MEDHKLRVNKKKEMLLQIKTLFKKVGPIEEFIMLPNNECIKLKGMCIEEKVELYT